MPDAPKTDRRRYTPFARLLHWLTVPLVAVLLVMAWLAEVTSGTESDRYYIIHMSLGITIFLVVLLRLAWRLTHRAPPPPADHGPVMVLAATLGHWLLYVILLFMPLSGFLMTGGESVSYFWLFDLPALPKNDAFSDLADNLHLLGQWAVYALILLHLAAVVYHVAWRRDGLLDRMLPPQRER